MDSTHSKHYFMKSLITINVFIIIAGGFLVPLWASFVHRIGGDIRTAGNAIAIFSIIIGVFTCIAGKIENQLDHDEYFLVGSQAMFVLGYACYFFVHHTWQLYLLQMWLGMAGAMQSPAIYSLYQRFMPKGTRNTAWGIWNGFYNISMGIGAFVSAYVAHSFGFNGVFTMMTLIALAGLVICCIVMRDIKSF